MLYKFLLQSKTFLYEIKKSYIVKIHRLGHHSTSDDSTVYRSTEEIAQWSTYAPLAKFREYLESLGVWCQEKEQELLNSTRKEILRVLVEAEKKLKPHWKELFTDVYKEIPDHIRY